MHPFLIITLALSLPASSNQIQSTVISFADWFEDSFQQCLPGCLQIILLKFNWHSMLEADSEDGDDAATLVKVNLVSAAGVALLVGAYLL
ncbi:hypothetical protein VTN49DRAFT_1125 [Thermomyces lanuginosus]|uniref:uncharacterized protein n=1 Tax=Thermomyces lanuginosus TaxID=5541 RepID=UPI00374396F0